MIRLLSLISFLFNLFFFEIMSEDLDQNKVNGVEESGDTEDVSKPVAKKVAKHDSGAADLEKVTDFEEEREISSEGIAGVSNHFALNFVNNFQLIFKSHSS